MVEDINEIAEYSSYIFGATFPFIRACLRWRKSIKPLFKWEMNKHDVANGLLLPYFFLLAISPMINGIYIDRKAIIMAGIYGIIMIYTDLIDHKK